MQQFQTLLECQTCSAGLFEITNEIDDWLRAESVQSGVLTLFIQHTSASLTIQENADPSVCRDLQKAFARLAPMDNSLYEHTAEGPDDMPAHIRSALSDVSLSIPIYDGRMVLGTWQGVYVFEHRNQPHRRRVVCHVVGE